MALLPQRFLFRLAAPCYYRKPVWTPRGPGLEERFRLADFGALEGQPARAEVRAAWSEEGLVFRIQVRGKRQPAWCRATRPEDSDGVQLFLDTRDVHTVHRATRFCHALLFLPSGGGSRQDSPVALAVPINRARENPRPVRPDAMQVRSTVQPDGYVLEAFIQADALTGYEPDEHPRLGFTYAVIDRELGEQTFTVGSPMPFREDPSLWGTLELVKSL